MADGGQVLPTMVPPPKPPDGESNKVPGLRLPYWLRLSEHHPRVQSRPNEIIDGTNEVIRNLRRLQSPSPDTRGFSRFSSRPSTPGPSMPHPPSQHQVPLHPPPPLPTAHRPLPPLPRPRSRLDSRPRLCATALGAPSQFPIYSYPPPPHLTPGLSPARFQQPPVQYPQLPPPPEIRLPPPPLSGSSQGQQGEYDLAVCYTGLIFPEVTERTTVLISFPVNSGMIGVAATTRICSWDTRKLFADFWLQMCENMEVDPQTAIIGYKISSDRVKDIARELSTEEDYKLAMESILKKTWNERSKTYMLILQNLVGVLIGLPTVELHKIICTASEPTHCRL